MRSSAASLSNRVSHRLEDNGNRLTVTWLTSVVFVRFVKEVNLVHSIRVVAN